MEKDIDSREAEQVDRTFVAAWHLQESIAPVAQLPRVRR